MVCYARKSNLLKPSGGISGSYPSCIATPVGFFLGECTMRHIPLTQGKFAIVDDGDYDYLMQWKWCAHKAYFSDNYYAVRNVHLTCRRSRTISMHRVVMHVPVGLHTDHINHNGLDNRKANLRICLRIQNQFNGKPRRNSASKYKGVYPSRAKWQARITCNCVRLSLGTFSSEIQAAKAYDRKAKELFGEFAYLNYGSEPCD